MGKVVEFKKKKENYENKTVLRNVITLSLEMFLNKAGLMFYEDLEEILGNDKIFYIKGFTTTKYIELYETLVLANEAGRILLTKNLKHFLDRDRLEVAASERNYIYRTEKEVKEISFALINDCYK